MTCVRLRLRCELAPVRSSRLLHLPGAADDDVCVCVCSARTCCSKALLPTAAAARGLDIDIQRQVRASMLIASDTSAHTHRGTAISFSNTKTAAAAV